MSGQHTSATEPLKLLVPDLPGADALLPYLRRIDAAARYSNRGPLVESFERRCAELLGGETQPVHCVSAASGTAALEIALRAARLAPGSRVLLPSFTFPATIVGVLRAGGVPVFADVDTARWVLVPEDAARLAAAARCRAVVPVAAFGVPLDLQAWDDLAAEHGLTVVVDAAGALGAMRAGRRVTLAFSLHATKPLGIGEGGLISTASAAVAERARRLANYGFASMRIREAGTNAKLSEYAAAVGLAQLERAPALLARRRVLWDAMRSALAGLPRMRLQHHRGDAAPANLVVRVAGPAARWQAHLARAGIESRRWYWPPLHRQPAFAHTPRACALVETERLARQALGLPFHTRMAPADIDRLARALASAPDGGGD